MDTIEAINTLANLKRYISGGGVVDRKASEAINMAIRALEVTADSNTVSRQQAIDAIEDLPFAQSERDIPKKVVKTIDMTCGFPIRKAFCPWCNVHIRELNFFKEDPHKISWCDICGQAIDWEGWDEE